MILTGLLGRSACNWRVSPAQVQRGRAAAEGAAGGPRLAHQTDRLSEEEPGGSAAAAREVSRQIISRFRRLSVDKSAAGRSVSQDGVGVAGERGGDRIPPVRAAAEGR